MSGSAATARIRLCGGKQAAKVLFEGNSGFLSDAVGIRTNSQQKSPDVIPSLLILRPVTIARLDVTSCHHFHSLRNTGPPPGKAIHRRKHRTTEYVSGEIKFIPHLRQRVGLVSAKDESLSIAESAKAQPSGRRGWPGREPRVTRLKWDAPRRIVHDARGATRPICGPSGSGLVDRGR